MIKRVIETPGIRAEFLCEEGIRGRIVATAGTRQFTSEWKPVLAVDKADTAFLQEFRRIIEHHRMLESVPLFGWPEHIRQKHRTPNSRWIDAKLADAEFWEEKRTYERALKSASEEAEKRFKPSLLQKFMIVHSGSTSNVRHFALVRGSLWSADRSLTEMQWETFVESKLAREDTRLHPGKSASRGLRPAIPSSVRQFVWRRDEGRCARCGSRERLEFDHIIPVSRGGANTERNIELLCETCNRIKSDGIS